MSEERTPRQQHEQPLTRQQRIAVILDHLEESRAAIERAIGTTQQILQEMAEYEARVPIIPGDRSWVPKREYPPTLPEKPLVALDTSWLSSEEGAPTNVQPEP